MIDVPILTGEAIADTALTVLNGQSLHYREIFNALHRAGYAIAGKDPLAVLCSALHRHPLIKPLGEGMFECDEEAMERLRSSMHDLRAKVVQWIDEPDERDDLIAQLQRTEKIVGRYGTPVARQRRGAFCHMCGFVGHIAPGHVHICSAGKQA